MRYVALLRGIGPGNPSMTGEKFRALFTKLGLTNVHPVIASGNIVFDSPTRSATALEKKIEQELPRELGFNRAAIVRSHEELKMLVKRNPYKDIKDERPNYLLVTFFKDRRKELCSVLNMDDLQTTKFMAALDSEHGKGITSRTWKTVHRILKKMESI